MYVCMNVCVCVCVCVHRSADVFQAMCAATTNRCTYEYVYTCNYMCTLYYIILHIKYLSGQCVKCYCHNSKRRGQGLRSAFCVTYSLAWNDCAAARASRVAHAREALCDLAFERPSSSSILASQASRPQRV